LDTLVQEEARKEGRLNKRSQTKAKMPYDSSTEKIVKRLEQHKFKTIPVINKYKEEHDVAVISGERSIN